MKSIKNMFISILSIIAFFSTSLSASNNPTPIVEIYNKDKDSIQVHISQFNYINLNVELLELHNIRSYTQYQFFHPKINMNTALVISIFKNNKLIGKFNINAPGKTKYLTWNSAKQPFLYPQTGPLMGLMGRYNPSGKGKTESGLPLNNNVSEEQITEVK
jgi:hypothetical protein